MKQLYVVTYTLVDSFDEAIEMTKQACVPGHSFAYIVDNNWVLDGKSKEVKK